MPLPINPTAKLIAEYSDTITRISGEIQSKLTAVADDISKLKLDNKISQLAGELGSGLNGLTSNVTDFANSAMGQVNDTISTIKGGIESVQATANEAINSLQSAANNASNISADISGALDKIGAGGLATGLTGIAGSISSAAGKLGDILSLKRSIQLPSGAESFIKQGTAIKLQPNAKNDWRVRINCQWEIFNNNQLFLLLESTGGVVWPYNPNITVSTKAEYTANTPVHSNYAMQSYKNSVVDDIQIAGDFSCETETDAAYWIAATTFFKTSTKMFFGQGEFAGNPPLICNLSGYGSSIFDKVPIVIKSFSVDLKDDVNYIKCNIFGTNTWVPVLSTITVTVSPIYSRERLRKFSLQDYAAGITADSSGIGYI
jgi:hypothetical protein